MSGSGSGGEGRTVNGGIVLMGLQILTMYYWVILLMNSDSHFSVHLIVGAAGAVTCYINRKEGRKLRDRWEKVLTLLFTFLFSTAVVAANYHMFGNLNVSGIAKVLAVIAVFLGGWSIFGNILIYLTARLRDFSFRERTEGGKLRPWVLFLLLMLPMAVINILALFLCEYPGNLTADSGWQVRQLMTDTYSNHNPVYHTLMIKVFVKVGLGIFGDINVGVALYCVAQILFMASCFAYGMLTLYQKGIPTKYILCCVLFYTLMPYHIVYSATVWKDVVFSGAVLLFVVSTFRILHGMGNGIANYLVFVLGSVGVCLLRSNGWFVYLMTSAIFSLLFRKKWKKLCLLCLCLLGVTFVLKHPVLAALNVIQPDPIESLSIPAQQIARVVSDCNDLTAEQRALLENVVEVDRIPQAYAPVLSDPIKYLVRETDNQSYLSEHGGEFIRLYFELGISHPVKYVQAWIDQTKGYWNGGYDNWRWSREAAGSEFGIRRTVHSEKVNQWLDNYLWIYENTNGLAVFLCIGFHVWIVILMCYLCLVRRDRVSFFTTLPVLTLILSLLMATPVYSEFRYAYAVFCVLPFLIFAPFGNYQFRKIKNIREK